MHASSLQSSSADKPKPAPRLLTQLRERIRYLHYSYRTEQAYVYWVRDFIRGSGLRHPKDLGKHEVEAYLSMLANERKVSPSTHKQALCAICFLYKEVLGVKLPWLGEIGRPTAQKRIPVVLTLTEIKQVFSLMSGVEGLIARLLYGTGLRLMEGLQLRVKDIDFDRKIIIVRHGKGGKDRVVMLPLVLVDDLRKQLSYAKTLWHKDRECGEAGVFMPYALEAKYPRASSSWAWHWVFPADHLSTAPQTGVYRRHHLYEERLSRRLKSACKSAGIEKHISIHTLRHSFATHLLQGGTQTSALCKSFWGTAMCLLR